MNRIRTFFFCSVIVLMLLAYLPLHDRIKGIVLFTAFLLHGCTLFADRESWEKITGAFRGTANLLKGEHVPHLTKGKILGQVGAIPLMFSMGGFFASGQPNNQILPYVPILLPISIALLSLSYALVIIDELPDDPST